MRIRKREGIEDFSLRKISTAVLKSAVEVRKNRKWAEDVRKAYLLAWKLKCKGITVFRYGSKKEQVLTFGEDVLTAEAEYAGGCPTKPYCPP